MTDVRTAREPNSRLAAVMAEADVSHKSLAARMRAEAPRLGLSIAPDHVSIRRWLDGVRPHEDTIRCLAAVLGAKLGRTITPVDLGFGAALVASVDIVDEGAAYSERPEQAVNLLTDLTDADLADSTSLAKSPWVSATAPGVITGYLFGEPSPGEHADRSASGAHIAERIRATTRHLMSLDFQYGGGHTRKMLLFYWKAEIAPNLRVSYPDIARREIFSAAADAAQMLGWSAYDAGRHGAAQRYLVQGLRLAREANDPLIGARLLSNLSHQANYLGNFSDAIQFARAAQAAAAGKASATVTSMLLAMEARALASIGDARSCAEILNRAEHTFAQRNPDDDPDWIVYFDALELAGEAAHCFRDLGKPNETGLFVTQAIDPLLTPPRTRAFIGMVSAAGAVAAGDLDKAIATASDAVGLAGSLQSDRYLHYLQDFVALVVGKTKNHPATRTFTDMIRVSYPTLPMPIF